MKATRLFAIPVVLLLCWAILPWVTSASHQNQSPRLSRGQNRFATSTNQSWLKLSDAVELRAEYPDNYSALELQRGNATAVSLASADLDEDGVPDLISGYALRGSGLVVLQRGNVDAIYPNTLEARTHRAQGQSTDAPFLPEAHTFVVPVSPDFIGAGDFDADGHWDVVTAARGGNTLQFSRGDGRGNLAQPEPIELPASVTTLTTGD